VSLIAEQIQRQYNPRQVGIVEFSESDEFCGKKLYPMQRVLLKLAFLEEMEGWEEDLLDHWIGGGRNNEIEISPEIRLRRDYCRDKGFQHFSEIDLIGGRRSSKGFVTGLAGTKKLWDVQQIEDPGAYYNIDIDKEIYFTCIAASLDQAKKFQFADLYSSITRCAALAPYISKAQEESISVKTASDDINLRRMKDLGLRIARDFSKLRVRPLAANADTLRGATSILSIFDEMAFMMPGESRSSAQECYNALEPSLAQFGPDALVFLNSSPYTKIGKFFEQAMHAFQGPDHPDGWYPMRFALRFPSWAMYDMWWKDPERRFNNAIMVSPEWSDVLDSDPLAVLDDMSLAKREHEQLEEKANPESYKVERRGQWAEVLDAYLDPIKVELAFGPKPDGTPMTRTFDGTYRFDYKMHCDPSSTTAGFGFAGAHVEEFDDPHGIFPDGKARHVVFDFVHRWNPQDFPGGTINYLKVQKDLAYSIEVYRPSELTFDQYNSVGLIQGLREMARKRNIETRISEVTATYQVNWNRWETFKTALYLGLVHLPPDCIDPATHFDYSEYASFELKFLQLIETATTRRVDKQTEGPIQTKDIADCICEVTNKFLANYIADFKEQNLAQALQMGSEGGYRIGGAEPAQALQGGNTRFDQFYGGRGRSPGFHPERGVDPSRRRR